jgi:hypothetical protein
VSRPTSGCWRPRSLKPALRRLKVRVTLTYEVIEGLPAPRVASPGQTAGAARTRKRRARRTPLPYRTGVYWDGGAGGMLAHVPPCPALWFWVVVVMVIPITPGHPRSEIPGSRTCDRPVDLHCD